MTNLEILFVATALLFHVALIVHFAIRKWAFGLIERYGWLFYTLSLPAAVVSLILLVAGQTWSFWLGGFIFLVWAIYGYAVEYVKRIEWRDPIRWPIFGPYVSLYLATVMFYWWPLALIRRPLWTVGAILFAIGTVLNVVSH